LSCREVRLATGFENVLLGRTTSPLYVESVDPGVPGAIIDLPLPPDESGTHTTRRAWAERFRNRFGWYMERAAAGEQILVTHRGRPRIRVGPAHEQVRLVA